MPELAPEITFVEPVTVAIPIVTPMGAVAVTPMPVTVPLPSVQQILPVILPKADFNGVIAASILPAPQPLASFDGASSVSALPSALPMPSFESVAATAALPSQLMPKDFTGAHALANLPSAQPLPSFESATAGIVVPPPFVPADFTGVLSSEVLPKAEAKFTSIISQSYIPPVAPQPPPVSFVNVQSSVNLPAPQPLASFDGASSVSVLPSALPLPSFESATAGATLPQQLTIDAFTDIQAVSYLPEAYKLGFESVKPSTTMPVAVSPVVFEQVTGEGKVKVMFPGGQKIVPVYGIGVPLGAEKPLLEPRIEKEEKGKED
jgi:hypothetical protein